MTHTVSQIKYGSKQHETTLIFNTLRENTNFIKVNKIYFHIEARIGFFRTINSELILQHVLRKKIEEICTWLQLDDDNTNVIMI